MVPSRSRSVQPATKNKVPIGSSQGMSWGAGNDPSGVYGYFEAMSAGQAMWSLTQPEWYPSASARWANDASAAPDAC